MKLALMCSSCRQEQYLAILKSAESESFVTRKDEPFEMSRCFRCLHSFARVSMAESVKAQQAVKLTDCSFGQNIARDLTADGSN